MNKWFCRLVVMFLLMTALVDVLIGEFALLLYFSESRKRMQVCGFQTLIFIRRFLRFVFILSEFLTKDVFKCIVNPTYLIGCCDSILINIVLKTNVLLLNATQKMGCCEYYCWLRWHDIRRVKSRFLNYPFLGEQFMGGII